MSDAPKRARLWQTVTELTRLEGDVDAWYAARTGVNALGNPYQGQFDSQLNAVLTEVKSAIAEVRQSLPTDLGKVNTGALYAALTRSDRQIVWIRRAWDFFRIKFDQRDHVPLLRALSAADEVLWSCYKLLFQKLGIPRPPAPLPYIELDYLPSAVLTSQGHLIDRDDAPTDGPLGDYFATLPIPVLRLPPAVVTAPWTMALVAHEVGHFVLPFLDQEGTSFLSAFRETISTCVHAEGGTPDQLQRWKQWAPEIFADWFAVVNVGGSVAWGIAQYERTVDTRMRTARTFYPSPEVRLLLVSEIARAHGLAVPGVDGLTGDGGEETTDHRIARRLAAATPHAIDGFDRPLSALASFKLDDHEDKGLNPSFVSQWTDALCHGTAADPPRHIRHPRLIAAAATRAWCRTSQLDDKQSQEAQATRIGDEAFRCIVASSQPETRTFDEIERLAPAGRDLKTRLKEATDDILMGGGMR